MALQLVLEVDDKGTVSVNRFASNVENRFKGVSGHADNLNKKLGGSLKTLSDGFGSLIKNVASFALKIGIAAAAAAGFMGIVGTVKGVVNEFAHFESALVDMSKVTDETLESIKAKIMSLPPELGSATEMVKGYYQVISAGVTEPTKALETLKVAAMAAKASHTEQAEVIKGLTKMMAGYEGEIKNVIEASDLLFTIEKEGQTSFQELIPVIGGVSKVSHDLGIKAQEMAGALALITQTAGSTSEAATQYRSILVALMKPSEALTELLQAQGFESAQAAIAQMGLVKTLKMIKDATGGSAQKMAELFGRQEALIGISALSANSFESLTQKIDAMGNSAGATEKAFERWKGTLSAIWQTFKNTIGKQVILLGEKLAPAIKTVIERLGKWLDKNRDMIAQGFERFLKVIYSIIKAFGPVVSYAVKGFSEWVNKNKELIATKLDYYLKTIVSIIDKYAIPAFKILAKAAGLVWQGFQPMIHATKAALIVFQKLAESIGWLASKASALYDKLGSVKRMLSSLKSSFLTVSFMGKGSSVKPLGEKIDEMSDKLKALSYKIESTEPEFEIDMHPASSSLEYIEDRTLDFADMVEGLDPQLDIDISPAQRALDALSAQHEQTMVQLQLEYANMMEAWKARPTYRNPAYEYQKRIAEEERAYEQKKAILSSYGGSSYSGGGYLGSSYSGSGYSGSSYSGSSSSSYSGGGTSYFAQRQAAYRAEKGIILQLGKEYIPRTGFYYLHKGEKVTPPTRTAKDRIGSMGFRDLIINVPESAAINKPEDWRYIVRNIIIPEIQRAGRL